MSEEEKSWGGCCLKGCLIFVILGVAIGYYVYVRTMRFARNTAAAGIEYAVERAVKNGLPPAESERILQTVKTFTGQIREGKISARQAANVAVAVGKSPVFFAMMALSFENRYIATSDLPKEDKEKAHVSVLRFSRGLIEEKIDKNKVEDVLEPLQEEIEKDGHKTRQFKKQVSREELQKTLGMMDDLSNQAKIVEAVEIDLPAEVEKAIQKGLQ